MARFRYRYCEPCDDWRARRTTCPTCGAPTVRAESPRRFPLLASHTAPLPCFYCQIPLAGIPFHDAGYAPGQGRYGKICRACGCRTYYDVDAPPAGAETAEAL